MPAALKLAAALGLRPRRRHIHCHSARSACSEHRRSSQDNRRPDQTRRARPHLVDGTSTPRTATGKLLLTLMGGIASFERDLMLERQRCGIAAAKAAGKYRGRKPTCSREGE